MAKPVEATLGYISLNRLAVYEIIQMDANFVALVNIYIYAFELDPNLLRM